MCEGLEDDEKRVLLESNKCILKLVWKSDAGDLSSKS